MTAVESTTLVEIGYDDSRWILQLEFRSRTVYSYFEVPGAVYEGLLTAPSKGKYFNAAIRGHFPHERVRTGMPGRGVKSDGANRCRAALGQCQGLYQTWGRDHRMAKLGLG